jgi:hypothetical protein
MPMLASWFPLGFLMGLFMDYLALYPRTQLFITTAVRASNPTKQTFVLALSGETYSIILILSASLNILYRRHCVNDDRFPFTRGSVLDTSPLFRPIYFSFRCTNGHQSLYIPFCNCAESAREYVHIQASKDIREWSSWAGLTSKTWQQWTIPLEVKIFPQYICTRTDALHVFHLAALLVWRVTVSGGT